MKTITKAVMTAATTIKENTLLTVIINAKKNLLLPVQKKDPPLLRRKANLEKAGRATRRCTAATASWR